MFTEREQAFLKGIAVAMLGVQRDYDLDDIESQELDKIFNNYLDDYFSHNPLSDSSDD